MPDIVPPGNTPLLTETDPANQIAAIGRETYDALWPRTILTYANAAARDADLPGLSTSSVAYARTKDNGIVWQWSGSAWVPLGGKRGESGVVTHNYAGGVGPVTTNVTFAVPFASPPAVSLGCNSISVQLYYGGLSVVGFTLNSRGFNGVAPPNPTAVSVSWTAVGA